MSEYVAYINVIFSAFLVILVMASDHTSIYQDKLSKSYAFEGWDDPTKSSVHWIFIIMTTKRVAYELLRRLPCKWIMDEYTSGHSGPVYTSVLVELSTPHDHKWIMQQVPVPAILRAVAPKWPEAAKEYYRQHSPWQCDCGRHQRGAKNLI